MSAEKANSVLLKCLADGLLKLQDAGHERDAEEPNPTRVLKTTYPG